MTVCPHCLCPHLELVQHLTATVEWKTWRCRGCGKSFPFVPERWATA